MTGIELQTGVDIELKSKMAIDIYNRVPRAVATKKKLRSTFQ